MANINTIRLKKIEFRFDITLPLFTIDTIIPYIEEVFNKIIEKRKGHNMGRNMIYTISRQHGSGGREVGRQLAERLGVKVYDQELLNEAAKNSGYSKELFEYNDEKATNSFLYALYMGSRYTQELPLNHRLFMAQFETIQKLAQEGPCVFVGRCADYALKDFENTVNAFVFADLEYRQKRVRDVYGVERKLVKSAISRVDKQRANYYNFYTDKDWSKADSYEICLDTSAVGIEGVVDILLAFGERKAEYLNI